MKTYKQFMLEAAPQTLKYVRMYHGTPAADKIEKKDLILQKFMPRHQETSQNLLEADMEKTQRLYHLEFQKRYQRCSSSKGSKNNWTKRN